MEESEPDPNQKRHQPSAKAFLLQTFYMLDHDGNLLKKIILNGLNEKIDSIIAVYLITNLFSEKAGPLYMHYIDARNALNNAG